MNFQSIIDQTQNNTFEQLIIPNTWVQGRTSYGGVVASLVLSAIKQQVDSDRPLRALTVSFIGPLLPDVPFNINVEELRQGKSLSQMQGRATQNGNVCTQVQAVYGRPLESTLNINEYIAPEIPAPEKGFPNAYVEGLTPEFLQHMDVIICEGDIPFSGGSSHKLNGWMRLKEPCKEFDELSLICVTDAWYPITLPLLKKFAPASTATWNLELVNPRPSLGPNDYLSYQATLEFVGDGYGFSKASIWSPKGELVALSHQMIVAYG